MRLLLVDDDAPFRALLRATFELVDVDLEESESVAEAQERLVRRLPDVIVLDLGLPGGDGHIVMERLRSLAALAHVPVIVVTARDPATSRDRVLTAGAHAFLETPIDMDRLLETVRDALGD